MQKISLLIFLLLSACVGQATNVITNNFSPPENNMDFECTFSATTPCTAGSFSGTGQLNNELTLDRGQDYVITYPFGLSKGTIKIEVDGIIQNPDPYYCPTYLTRDPTQWNSDCRINHEIAIFRSGDQEIFKIIMTERDTQYDRWPVTLNVLFDSPQSTYANPATGIVNAWNDGVVCRFQNISNHTIEIHYDFTTQTSTGYAEASDYIFITCDGKPGRPRLMDEIPEFQADNIIFRNTDPSLPNNEVLRIKYFGFDNKDIEWCGNGYCAPGEENSCARDCGCTEGYLYWSNNSCTIDYSHLEYFGHYRRTATGDYSAMNQNPGNIFVDDQNRNYFNQYFIYGNEGSDSINHPAFGYGQLALTTDACQEYDKYKNYTTRNLTQNEIAWAVLDEPTHYIHNYDIPTIDWVVQGVKNLYPSLNTYVVFNYDEPAPDSIDWIGIDPYIFPIQTSACEEYGKYYRLMYYTWEEKQFPTITHYEQFNKPIILIGRAYNDTQRAVPSVCQQNWYYETALGNPNIKGLLYFAWAHPAVQDLKEMANAYPEMIDYHQQTGSNFEVTQQIPEREGSITPGTWEIKNDYTRNESKVLSFNTQKPTLENGAIYYTEEFSVNTSINNYTALFYAIVLKDSDPQLLLQGDTYDELGIGRILDTYAIVIEYGNQHVVPLNTKISLTNYDVHYFGIKDGKGQFLFSKPGTESKLGYILRNQTETFDLPANGNQKYLERISDLNPEHYQMVSLEFAESNLCNSFFTTMGTTGAVVALVIDNETFPIWKDYYSIYLAFTHSCSELTETCNGIDDNCNNIIDEFCYGDTDGDGSITILELLDAISKFRATPANIALWDERYDMNNDDIINTLDYTHLVVRIN